MTFLFRLRLVDVTTINITAAGAFAMTTPARAANFPGFFARGGIFAALTSRSGEVIFTLTGGRQLRMYYGNLSGSPGLSPGNLSIVRRFFYCHFCYLPPISSLRHAYLELSTARVCLLRVPMRGRFDAAPDTPHAFVQGRRGRCALAFAKPHPAVEFPPRRRPAAARGGSPRRLPPRTPPCRGATETRAQLDRKSVV